MTLKVIGAGFGRTGTLSLKLALEQIGFGPCYHMVEVFSHPEHVAVWRAAACGEEMEWDALYEGYKATVDWPSTRFWKDLADVYPDAKVILTPREPESWWKSFSQTILPGLSGPAPEDEGRRSWFEMVNLAITEQTFGGDLSKANVLKVYKAHIEDVRAAVPRARLLEFDVNQGWGPLCAFLGVDVPATDFPRTNSTEEFVGRVMAAKK